MSERILRRTTTTVEEYLGAPCPPCATPRGDLADAAEPAANDSPACATAPANDAPACASAANEGPACSPIERLQGLIGRTFSVDDDDDGLAGASCPRPSEADSK